MAHLQQDPANANKGTVRGLGMVERSLQQFGAGRSILASADGVILAGNKTYDRAIELGIPVQEIESDGHTLYVIKRTDLPYDDPRAKELAIADNRASETGLAWDADVLTALQDDGIDLGQFWFEDELAAVLAGDDAPTVGLTDPDDVPAVPDAPITRPGDMWLLGRHRVMCGSATSAAARARLFDGISPDIIFTDPPYSSGGFQEAGKRSGSIGTRQNATIQQDNLSTRGYLSLLSEALNGINADVLYVFTDWRMWPWTLDVAEREGWPVRNMLVWAKPTMGMGFPWRAQHELILFGKRTSAQMRDGKRGNVLGADRSGNKNHPTEKPVALLTDVLTNTDGALIYDPFGGSGSALIACEDVGRRALVMELVPQYCDVIVRRWEQFTGQTAQRETQAEAAD